MPIVENSKYKPPKIWYKNPHLTTIYVSRFLKTDLPNYERERLELADGDFIDVDYLIQSPTKAIILCHGLEGMSTSTYNNKSANYFRDQGFSVFAWNNRSCSGEMNRLLKLYHHAVVEDLEAVIQSVIAKGFEEIYLLGFSMGAAHILNYLGRCEVDSKIKGSVAVSAPIQLKDSSETLKRGFNRIYLKNFTYKIAKKLAIKREQFPDALDWGKLERIKSFDEIDEYFTAPTGGFIDREDYYKKASPAYSLDGIKHPVLILNALDDPFLGDGCYPIDFAKRNPYVFLELTKNGGHCAYPSHISKQSYSEIRAFEFFQNI